MSEREEYTPDTGAVRAAYTRAMRQAFIASTAEHIEEFDRWLAAHDRALREQIAREYGIGDLTSRPLRDAQDEIARLESLVNYLRRENRRLDNTIARRDQRCEDLAASLDEMRAAHSPTTTTTRRTP